MKKYDILYFDKVHGFIGVKFENHECYNFIAPFKNGAYLSGIEFEDAIQLLYPFSSEELIENAKNLVGGEYIESKVLPPINE